MVSQAKLRSDLVVAPSVIDGETFYTIKDTVTGSYFRLREPEYWLIQQLDGHHSAEQIAQAFTAKFEAIISSDDVVGFITQLEKLYFLEDGRSEQELARVARKTQQRRSLLSHVLYIRIVSFSPERFVGRLYKMFSLAFSRPWLAIQLILLTAGLIVLVANVSEFSINLRHLFSLSTIPTLILAFFLVVGLHEFAHAVVCRHYGGQVQEMGLMLMFFQPCFYSDVSDAWLFPRKSQRLFVTFAGPHFQMMLIAFGVIVWRLTVPGTTISNIAHTTAVVGWVTLLFNFNPLIKLDGYYLLSDLLDISNLRQKSFTFVGTILKRHLLGWPVEAEKCPPRERVVFVTYATLASVYSMVLVLYLASIIAQYLIAKLGGFGLLLLIVVVGYILRPAIAGLAHGTAQHFRYMRTLTKRPIRLISYLAILVVVLVLLLAVPLPFRVSGEISTQPIADFALVLNQAGLLESSLRTGGERPDRKTSFMQMTSTEMALLEVIPLAKDGQIVRAGDTIAAVTSNQIAQEIAAGKAELERLTGTLTLLKAPKKREEIAEAVAQLEAAKATHDQAARDYDRTEELVKKNLLSKDKLETSHAALDVAQAQVNNRRSALELLKSPPRPEEEAVLLHEVDKQRARLTFLEQQSRAQRVIAPIGGLVAATRRADTIMTVTDLTVVELQVPVSDFDINLVRPGQAVSLKVRSFPDRVFSGQVVRVPHAAGARVEGVRFPVSVVVDNSDGLLAQGMSGYAKISVGERSLIGLASRKILSVLRVEFWSWW